MIRAPITPPVIVSDSGDVNVFETIDDAEKYLEPYDVGSLTAYDSEGRLLRLIATSPRITIEVEEWSPSHQEDVRRLLLDFLNELGIADLNIRGKNLQELVAIGLTYKTK